MRPIWGAPRPGAPHPVDRSAARGAASCGRDRHRAPPAPGPAEDGEGHSHCCFASEDGHLVSVSAFDDRPAAEAANAKARGWVAAGPRDALPDPPEVLAGGVRRRPSGQARGGAEGAHVAVREYEGVRSIERLTALADEHVLPAIRQPPGPRGHRTFVSGEHQGRVVAVSVFDARENAMRVSDRVVGIMRERAKEVVPNAPRVTSGTVAVATMAA
jgi:hypothetical protein